MSTTANMHRLHYVLSGAPRPTAPRLARKYDEDAARIEKHSLFYAMLGIVPPPVSRRKFLGKSERKVCSPILT